MTAGSADTRRGARVAGWLLLLGGFLPVYLGLLDTQPLVTLGAEPTEAQLSRGHRLLWLGAAAHALAVVAFRFGGLAWRYLPYVGAPGLAAALLSYAPASRAPGYAGLLLLGPLALVAASRGTAERRRRTSRQPRRRRRTAP